jgi:hypothetical protein
VIMHSAVIMHLAVIKQFVVSATDSGLLDHEGGVGGWGHRGVAPGMGQESIA